MRYFSTKPPANRLAQIEHDEVQARLSGSVVIVVVALSVLLVALIIVLQALLPAAF